VDLLMLSVRLPEDLETQFDAYCATRRLRKSQVVQTALRRLLSEEAARAQSDPFLAMVGSGNGRFSTEDIMRMSRGDDWNQP
jgi:metal-responsive CopG/Arc/MetJ family transcriptional regulator